ncbi:SURF1 family protein [Pseudoroseicyclus tamaricis]|uniref:SURF1-like protein n=1 Tax=Pseudoroseicyclus tamaricis TaxID=2705421 RepID=A0A6B2JU04_9RHOB|nr:SURF1 family protein [Pseudoroseicyclus tamaricis]NDV01768.1 SURF1 family protein [Pseudoroseicyclus tamaricis]
MRRIIPPLIFGILGCAVLISLGVWQLRRLEWKESVLAEIEMRIASAPVPLEEAEAEYAPVTLSGEITGPALRFIYSGTEEDIVAAVQTEAGRRVIVDLGLVPARPMASAPPELPEGRVEITGNLVMPVGRGGTLHLDQSNAWAARELGNLAEVLGAEPVFVVARQIEPTIPGLTPLPVSAEGIPNNHFGYAIQWFGIALVWAGMSLYLIRRTLRAKD